MKKAFTEAATSCHAIIVVFSSNFRCFREPWKLVNFSRERGEKVHESPLPDHERDSFKNLYSDGFYLLEGPVNNASEVA